MHVAAFVAGIFLLLLAAVDIFETVVLPRRVAGRFRLTRFFYRTTWTPWSAIARRVGSKRQRETFLSVYGPLSLLALLGVWIASVIVAFTLLRWASLADGSASDSSFALELYSSALSFVGLEEVVQHNPAGRVLMVLESVFGFGVLALVIGYFPVLYQAFSRREANISLLDARAGSPPSAAELMRHYGAPPGLAALPALLHDWERWAAELLESHISYTVLGYFRSQHDNQSWLAAITTVLDSCALVMIGEAGEAQFQAQLTFAMARHALVDLAKLFNVPPRRDCFDRLPSDDLARLREMLAHEGISLPVGDAAEQRLTELRKLYEPYLDPLSRYLLMDLPGWLPATRLVHNWQTSKWERVGLGLH